MFVSSFFVKLLTADFFFTQQQQLNLVFITYYSRLIGQNIFVCRSFLRRCNLQLPMKLEIVERVVDICLSFFTTMQLATCRNKEFVVRSDRWKSM